MISRDETKSTAASKISLPLRHSSKSQEQLNSSRLPLSYCQVDTLPLTPRHRQDLQNSQYYLLYDLVGSRFCSSFPDLIAGQYEAKTATTGSSTFYQIQSRSSWRTAPPTPARPIQSTSPVAKFLNRLRASFSDLCCFGQGSHSQHVKRY